MNPLTRNGEERWGAVRGMSSGPNVKNSNTFKRRKGAVEGM